MDGREKNGWAGKEWTLFLSPAQELSLHRSISAPAFRSPKILSSPPHLEEKELSIDSFTSHKSLMKSLLSE
jgi:hypothetical protein